MAPKEKDICIAFYKHFKGLQAYGQLPKDLLLFHIANEQYTTKTWIFQLKRMGLVSGVADYCILLPRSRVAFIEFKRDAKRELTASQQWFKGQCAILDIPYCVASSVEDGIEFIQTL